MVGFAVEFREENRHRTEHAVGDEDNAPPGPVSKFDYYCTPPKTSAGSELGRRVSLERSGQELSEGMSFLERNHTICGLINRALNNRSANCVILCHLRYVSLVGPSHDSALKTS